jgi:short-subunit dehydrogenase
MAILVRKADYLKALAGELRQSGATVQDLTCDVRDRRQITDAFRAIREELGDSEVLLYNAGSGTFGGITEIAPDQATGGSTPSGRLSRPKKSRPQ